MAHLLRCPACKCDVSNGDVKHEDYLAISLCCDEEVEKVWLCKTCSTREPHAGEEHCLSCLADAIVESPAELVYYGEETVAAVAKELAERMRPYLSRRQAA